MQGDPEVVLVRRGTPWNAIPVVPKLETVLKLGSTEMSRSLIVRPEIPLGFSYWGVRL